MDADRAASENSEVVKFIRQLFDGSQNIRVTPGSRSPFLAFPNYCGLILHLIRLPSIKTHRRDIETCA
jgi:hypothetical protein